MTRLYIYYGPDDFQVKEAVARLKAGLDADGMLESNTVLLDGSRVTFDELAAVCNTVPFLSQLRLVIVEGLLGRFESSRQRRSGRAAGRSAARGGQDLGEWDGLAALLAQLPPTTVLLLVDGPLAAANPLLTRVRAMGEVHEFQPLQHGALTAWIAERGKAAGASLTPGALRLLAEYVGNNLWQLASEIEKLALYARGRAATEDDVRTLVSASVEVNVFALVDAVVAGRRDEALRLLQRLLNEGGTAPQLLGLLSTQYRRLLLTRELLDARTPHPEIGRQVGIASDFALRKVTEQASRYPLSRLETAYRRLLDADVATKTGLLDEDLALELLIDDLCAVARR